MNFGAVITMPETATNNDHFLQLVEREQSWLAKQEKGVQKQLLNVYKETFANIRQELAKLPEAESYTRRHARAVEAQLAVLIQEAQGKQSRILGSGMQRIYEQRLPAEQRVWTHLEDLFGSQATADQFRAIKPLINQRSVKALLTTQNVSIKNFNDDLTKKVRGTVASSMIQGHGIKKTVQRLKEVESLQGHESRLKLIARMETARANNQAKQDFIKQVNDEHPELDLWQIARDRVDKSKKTRNHWFSWALDRTVRNVTLDDFFEVHTPELTATMQSFGAITGRKASYNGLLFASFDQGRRGKSLPAHFGDRGVVLAWRPNWGLKGLADVKYPQARRSSAAYQKDEPVTLDDFDANAKKAQKLTKTMPELQAKALATKVMEAELPERLLTAPVKGQIKAIQSQGLKDRHIEQINKGKAQFESLVGPAMDGQQIRFIDSTSFKKHPVYKELKKQGRLDEYFKAGYIRGHDLIVLTDKSDETTVIHELLHWYEDKNPEVLALSKQLIQKKLDQAGAEKVKLKGHGILHVDGFKANDYSGNVYYDQGEVVMTEVLTGVADLIYNSKSNGALQALSIDKEHLEVFIKAVSLKWHS